MSIKSTFVKMASSLVIASLVTSSVVPAVTTTYANALAALGTPFNTEAQYDVTVPHVVIHQLYGAGLKKADDAYFSHGFIELYNNTDEDIDLEGWSLQYADRGDNSITGSTLQWQMFELEGIVPAKSSFLIVGKETGTEEETAIDLTDRYDMQIDIFINNKGMKAALVSNQELLTAVNPYEEIKDNYVDLVGTGSNDKGSEIDGFEFNYPSGDTEGTSKKKAIVRKNASDTDRNKDDFIQVDYSKISAEDLALVAPRGKNDGAWTPAYPAELPPIDPEENEEEDNQLGDTLIDQIKLNKIGEYVVGVTNEDGGVAEIVKYNADNQKFYLVNGSTNPPSLDIVSLEMDNAGKLKKEKTILVQTLAETGDFEYGDLTSVDVNTAVKEVVVAVAEKDANKAGKALVLNYEGELLREYMVGKQPDMITRTADGRYILTANEGEPRDEGIDPEGSVSIIDTVSNEVTTILFDDVSLIDDAVIIRGQSNEKGKIIDSGTKEDAKYDLEPEYIAITEDGRTAYVSLQENNAIATIDIINKQLISVHGLGFKDHALPGNELDAIRDDKIKLESLPFKGIYMPDGIAAVTIDGTPYVFTANEGDATAWDGRDNESDVGKMKALLDPESDAAKFLAGKTMYDKLEGPSGMPNDNIYLYGARSFSIWNGITMNQVYDSGSQFERVTGQRYPLVFNASNSNSTLDSRSTKKGPEPEDIKVGKVGTQYLAFVGLERIGGIVVYNVTDPANAAFVNYTNTRDYNAGLATDTAPEGIEFISSEQSPTGKPLLLVAHEVGGTVAVYELDIASLAFKKEEYQLRLNAQSFQIDRELVVSEEQELVWSSSDTTIASIDEAGKLILRKTGKVVITAQTSDGYSVASTEVTILPNNNYVNNEEENQNSENEEQTEAGNSYYTISQDNNSSVVVISLNRESVLKMQEEQLHIATQYGEFSLQRDQLQAFIEQIGGNTELQLAISALKDEQNGLELSLQWKSGDKLIENGPNAQTIKLPYALKAGQSGQGITVYEKQGDGTLKPLLFTKYIGNELILTKTAAQSLYITYQAMGFNDVKQSTSYGAIHSLFAKGIMKGVAEDTFAPGKAMTRAEMITVLSRLVGSEDSTASSVGFSDVLPHAYYAAAVNWAVAEGITTGVSPTSFAPHQQVTKEQAATLLYRVVRAQDYSIVSEKADSTLAARTAISKFAQEAVDMLQQWGIIQESDSQFNAQQVMTREEVAVWIDRLLMKLS